MMSCKHRNTHSARHSRRLSSLSRALLAMVFSASTTATRSEPRQMDPNEVVTARRCESRTPREQNAAPSAGTNHHVPTVPATVTWTTFLTTWNVQ
jgi:hypothetical protein